MTSTPFVLPAGMEAENNLPVNNVLKNSYDHAKKQLQDGVQVLHDSISQIKDEFLGIYDKAAHYVNKMAMPVNNFIKDLAQIEAEFQAELNGKPVAFGGCSIVPIEEALKRPMEENY